MLQRENFKYLQLIYYIYLLLFYNLFYYYLSLFCNFIIYYIYLYNLLHIFISQQIIRYIITIYHTALFILENIVRQNSNRAFNMIM